MSGIACVIVMGLVLALWVPGIGLIGLWIDSEHRKNLDYRRSQVAHVLLTDVKTFPGMDPAKLQEQRLLCADCVLGNNAFMTFIARFKMLFGGEVKSFHGVITRLRQEVVVQLMEQAAEQGFDAICNVRLESVDISASTTGRSKKKQLFVGMIAYGTAYRRAEGIYPPPAPPQLWEAPA